MDNVKQYENGIKPHGKGIQITFIWNGERHRPTLRIEPTKNNLKFAGQLKSTIEREIALGTYTKEKYGEHFPTSQVARDLLREKKATEAKKVTTTFKALSDKWLLTKSKLSLGTLIGYKSSLKFWNAHIGNENIEDIKRSTLEVLANSQKWSEKTRNDRLIPVRGVFDLAWCDELIKNDPTEKIKFTEWQRKPCNPLEAEEVEMVLEYMKKNLHPQIANFFEFSFSTGLRPSEMISLRWEDIDWRYGLVRVQRARTYNVEHSTKTKKVRDIEMNDRANKVLLAQKQYTFLKNGYIFEYPRTNKPYRNDRPLRRVYWNPTIEALGLPKRKFYQTRHTFATLNLRSGADPQWVSEQLGHANMGMLLTVYSKWNKGSDKGKQRNKLDVYFASDRNNNKNNELLNSATNLPQTKENL